MIIFFYYVYILLCLYFYVFNIFIIIISKIVFKTNYILSIPSCKIGLFFAENKLNFVGCNSLIEYL
jgi:hypothetical protein